MPMAGDKAGVAQTEVCDCPILYFPMAPSQLSAELGQIIITLGKDHRDLAFCPLMRVSL
jgi:hypothetical protein